jgi:hypothetical protein
MDNYALLIEYEKEILPEKRLFLGILIRLVQDAEMIVQKILHPRVNYKHRDSYDLTNEKAQYRKEELLNHLSSEWLKDVCYLADIDHTKFKNCVLKILSVKKIKRNNSFKRFRAGSKSYKVLDLTNKRQRQK